MRVKYFTEGVVGDIRVTTRYDAADPFRRTARRPHGPARDGTWMPATGRDQPVGVTGAWRSREPIAPRDDHRAQRAVPALPAAAGAMHYAVSGPNGHDNVPDLTRAAAWCASRPTVSYSLHRRSATGAAARGGWRLQPAGRLERRHGTAFREPPEHRCRQLPAGYHWALGSFGYFPFYALDDIAASCGRPCAQLPDVDAQLARGDFAAAIQLAAREHARVCAASGQGTDQAGERPAFGANALLRYR